MISRIWRVLSGRVFGIFPSYSLSLHGYCLRSLECVEGACIVRRPSYMHHPPIAILLGVNPVHLILAFFVLHEPLRPGPRAPSVLASCIRSYDFAPLRDIRVLPEGSVVDGESKRERERRGDGGTERIWKKRSKMGRDARKARDLEDEGSYCSQYHSLGDISRSTQKVNHYFIRVNIESELAAMNILNCQTICHSA